MKGCRPLTDKEVARISGYFASRDARRDLALFVLGVKTGFRISELLSLRIGDVLAGEGIVDRVRVYRRNMKKKREGRTVVLHPLAKQALAAWLQELQGRGRTDPETAVFLSRKGDALPISRAQAWRVLQVAFEACGVLGQTGTHSMRKTFAKNMYSALGGDIIQTQRALGHRNINTTVQYLSFSEKEIDAAILSS